MDYRKFLGQKSSAVLPYLGGAWVHDVSRRLRVSVEQPAGWYRFEISGRSALPLERAEPPDLGHLPAVRGHFALGWLFGGGRDVCRVELLPEEEPAVLSPVTGRRWPSGAVVFDSVEFETEAEDAARRALEELRGIDELKGVGASLRAAFGWALTARVATRMETSVSPREVMGSVLDIAKDGASAAERFLESLAERRRLERARVEAWAAAHGHALGPALPPGAWQRPVETDTRSPIARAAHALEVAGAEMSGARALGNGLLEVTYRFLDERFISVVDERSLQVVDAGICLSGEDRQVTLESLPSVIREGYDSGELNITRY